VRPAQQPGAQPLRPAALDRGDDDRLGQPLDLPAVRHHPHRVLCPAPAHRSRGSWLLPRRGAVPLALVPGRSAWADHGPVHVGDSGFRPTWRAVLRLDPGTLRCRPTWLGRLAMDVPDPGAADCGAGDPGDQATQRWLPQSRLAEPGRTSTDRSRPQGRCCQQARPPVATACCQC